MTYAKATNKTDKKLRVLFLQSQTFFGADTAVHAMLMRHFDRNETEVHVACNQERLDDPLTSARDQIERIPDLHILPTDFGPSTNDTAILEKLKRVASRGVAVPLTLLKLAGYIRRHRIDVIHCTEKPRDAFYGVLLAKMTGAKAVIHLHVGYADWLKPNVRWALREASAVIGVSQFVADTAIAAGLSRDKVYGIPNCIDLQDPARAAWSPDADGAPVRKELGIPADALVMGHVGRFFSHKGQGDMVEAVASLKDKLPTPWRLVLVGDDDRRAHPGGGSFRAELEQRVKELGVEKNVVFTGFRTDIARIFSCFDMYTMPTFEEPLGLVFLEALAVEKPVVAYRSGGVPEVVTHGECGLLTEPKDKAALANAILTLANDPARRKQMGKAGRRRVEQVLNPQQMCAQVVAVYRSAGRDTRTVSSAAGSTRETQASEG